MVRARRVRAVVACTQSDECCSPNPKRKDNVKTITHFFTAMKGSDLAENILSDLDDVEKEKFKELPDVLLVDDFADDKLPATPHRIELRDDKEELLAKTLKDCDADKLAQLRADSKTLFKEIQLPLLSEDIDIVCVAEGVKVVTDEAKEVGLKENGVKLEEIAIPASKVNNGGTKARRRLNNGGSNQPKARSVAKNNENQKANHKLTEYFPVRRSERKTKKTVLEEKQRTLEENLRSGVERGLRVFNFPGKGRGIVAMRVFSRGDFVVEYAGDLIDMQEARGRELKYAQDQNTGCYMYYFKYKSTQYCIDATAETGRLGRLVNHSRSGNLITRVIEVDKTPRLVLVAKDAIEVGEEVTYDYGDRSKESLMHHPWLAY